MKIEAWQINYMQTWCERVWNEEQRRNPVKAWLCKVGIIPITRNDLASDLNAFSFLKYHPNVIFTKYISNATPKNAVVYLIDAKKLLWFNKVKTKDGSFGGWHEIRTDIEEVIEPVV